MKRVSFKTLGCRLNQAETAAITAGFLSAGYGVVEFGEPCDVAVVHTCTITARAEQKCLMYARSIRKANPRAVVALAGCAVEVGGEALRQRCGADLAVGQRDKFRIPALLTQDGTARSEVGSPRSEAEAQASCPETLRPSSAFRPPPSVLGPRTPPLPSFSTTRALIKVQDGCDFRCAYCIVPDARGAPVSRPLEDVLAETRALATEGFREVTLTGANLGCYADAGRRLPDLIRAVETIQGIDRIRLSSIETSTSEREVVEQMASSAKLCPFLHLPLQTGDDRMLAAMGRRYTAAQYRDFAAFAARCVPDIGLGTDILVGLPGETEEAFENTVRLVEELPFSNLHVFPYSPRPGTRAAAMAMQVPVAERRERAERMIALGDRKRATYVQRFIGRPVSVLVEELETPDCGIGWTGQRIQARIRLPGIRVNQIVNFTPQGCDGDVLV